jgi:gamma-glutamyl-gamma-aminobutyrate hydrolase PuuD
MVFLLSCGVKWLLIQLCDLVRRYREADSFPIVVRMESVNLHFQIQKEEKKTVAACRSVQKLPTFIQESHNEYQYLKLIDDIIVNGSLRKVTAQAQEQSPSLAVRRNSVYQSVSVSS